MNPRELNAEVMAYVALIAEIFAEGLARSEAARSPVQRRWPGDEAATGAPQSAEGAGSRLPRSRPAALF